ncbi:MAG: tRNA uridine-5-carboxymethylaminomethyl(34) synthesis GTPase MnmE [bacterium]
MTDSYTDTIAAIATAPGEGAIAIVRLTGPASLEIADRVFRGKGRPPSRRAAQTFVHGTLVSENGVIDEVILLIYRAPHSYTREDSVEFQGHGGSAAAKRILRTMLEAGARMAEPGEFTKRAFLSGRIDLLQAEAVLDLIRARSDRAADAALEQLSGSLSKAFEQLYDDTLALAANLEATLDFSEDELPASVMQEVIARRQHVDAEFKRLLDSWDEGHLLREGALVVISGKPNVGKSTLLNALVGKNRAIVTPIAGTTRDTIEEHVVINGFTVRIVDTAGLRETPCEIEKEGVSRAISAISGSDCNIYVIDGTLELDDQDESNLSLLNPSKTIIAINKCDSHGLLTTTARLTNKSDMLISAKNGIGIEALKQAIISKLGIHGGGTPHAAISERHRHLLVSAHKDIVESGLLLARPTPEPALAASRLRGALETLGQVTGRIYHEELLNTIFSRFCIGK